MAGDVAFLTGAGAGHFFLFETSPRVKYCVEMAKQDLSHIARTPVRARGKSCMPSPYSDPFLSALAPLPQVCFSACISTSLPLCAACREKCLLLSGFASQSGPPEIPVNFSYAEYLSCNGQGSGPDMTQVDEWGNYTCASLSSALLLPDAV
jgi:hypothetical protein